MKIAVFPGSFDPITLGHVDLVQRALPLFDKVIVAIGVNNQKKALFTLEKRLSWLKDVFKDEPKVEIGHFEGLTVNYCKEKNARFLMRGLRSSSDFDYEKIISQLNFILGDSVETIFLISNPEFSYVSSTIVREIITGKGDVSKFVPKVIVDDMLKLNY